MGLGVFGRMDCRLRGCMLMDCLMRDHMVQVVGLLLVATLVECLVDRESSCLDFVVLEHVALPVSLSDSV